MIIQQHKDIDATEAKVMYGLSLKKMAILCIAGAVVLILTFSAHVPVFVSSIIGGLIMFLGIYKKQNMPAPVLIIRLFKAAVMKPTYCREEIATCHTVSRKQQEKAAVAWNRELHRQKRKHPEMSIVRTVRCTRNKKSRK